MDLSQDDLTSVRQEVLHELILRQPNPGSPQKSYMDLAQDNLTPVHQEVLHELTSPSNPTSVPSLQDAVLHGLVTQKPYTGSPFPKNEVLHELIIKVTLPRFLLHFRYSFTQTHQHATLHRFPLSTYSITVQNLPRRIQSSSPGKVGIHLPKQ